MRLLVEVILHGRGLLDQINDPTRDRLNVRKLVLEGRYVGPRSEISEAIVSGVDAEVAEYYVGHGLSDRFVLQSAVDMLGVVGASSWQRICQNSGLGGNLVSA
jgi:hypothetical protein